MHVPALISYSVQLLSTPIGISFLAVLACICYYIPESENRKLKIFVQSIYFLLFVFVAYKFLSNLNYRFNNFLIWDFTSWYLWGKLAAQGYNFYLPENSQTVFNTLVLPDANFDNFIDAIVNVGFLYPPPTMLYFFSLGFMSYDSALIVWTLFILVFLGGCIYVVYCSFLKESKLKGFLLVTILFFINPSVNLTVICSQTNFIVLFYLLLMKKYEDHKYAGVLLALAFFTKPFMLIFGIYFLLNKNWKAILYFISSSLVISGISIFAFGTDTFMSYFFNNATKRLPEWTFSEDINQSLNAVLLRANLISVDKPYVFLIIASGLLFAMIIYLIHLQRRRQNDIIWALLLLVGLLIYPGTLSYYAVVMLFITFQFFHNEQPLGMNLFLVIPVIGLFYYLNSVSVFTSICFLLFIVILKSLWQLKKNNSSIEPVTVF